MNYPISECYPFSNLGRIPKLGRIVLSLALFGAVSTHAEIPDGFTKICTLEENCAVEESTLVAFGQQGQYTYRTLSGNFLCTAKTFGETQSSAEAACMALDHNPVSLVMGSSSSGGDVDRPTVTLQAGLYVLISRSTGKALSIDKGSHEDDATLVQQDFVGARHQIWRIAPLGNGYHVVSAHHSGKALESQDWDTRDGATLKQLPWMNNWNQQWRFQEVGGGFYRVHSRYSGQALDAFERQVRGPVRLWTYWGGDNQHWRLVPIADTPEQPGSDTGAP